MGHKEKDIFLDFSIISYYKNWIVKLILQNFNESEQSNLFSRKLWFFFSVSVVAESDVIVTTN